MCSEGGYASAGEVAGTSNPDRGAHSHPPLQLWPCSPGRCGMSGTTDVKTPVRPDSKAGTWVPGAVVGGLSHRGLWLHGRSEVIMIFI